MSALVESQYNKTIFVSKLTCESNSLYHSVDIGYNYYLIWNGTYLPAVNRGCKMMFEPELDSKICVEVIEFNIEECGMCVNYYDEWFLDNSYGCKDTPSKYCHSFGEIYVELLNGKVADKTPKKGTSNVFRLKIYAQKDTFYKDKDNHISSNPPQTILNQPPCNTNNEEMTTENQDTVPIVLHEYEVCNA
ncbi:uncharacterized protein LOC133187994 [Saccostrea echinata]|uniref:uncharacterized protein LOC133187994 n=1 Tax=Saccostrea echinata TaxID=191078 RepID=UPI002A7EDDD3|nr:uncharacterized protein LOC133187994 [Saccostrea echinata]